MNIEIKQQAALVWLITEIIQIIFIIMGGIMLLWLYAPYSFFIKFFLTLIAGIITFDIFKSFVYVRWILWKEANMEE